MKKDSFRANIKSDDEMVLMLALSTREHKSAGYYRSFIRIVLERFIERATLVYIIPREGFRRSSKKSLVEFLSN